MSIDPEDEDDVVTLKELVEFETRNLTGCDNDDSCCTFPKGYVNRQALYACLTCLKLSNKLAGVCYPCSVHCHEGHDLLDLYTKRNFRCDCGNGSFPENFICKLWEEKDDVNIKNAYNRNFSNFFCLCGSQYKEETEDMYQCNICEDWFHLTCLTNDPNELIILMENNIDDSKEFTCKSCIHNYEYLRIYNLVLTSNNPADDNITQSCKLLTFKTMSQLSLSDVVITFGVFWSDGWRQSLCNCISCMNMYKSDQLDFLLDKKDSMSYYYSQAENQSQSHEELEEVLTELPHTQAITIAEGIASFKRNLTKFMNSQDPSKVVTSKNVKDFFDNLKKRRLDGDSED